MRWLLPLLLLQPAAAANEETGSLVCRRCHAEIYRQYSATGMFRSSGKVGEGVFRESLENARFSDPVLHADYRVSAPAAAYRLEFSRGETRGERTLEWFVGSGRVARSYFFSIDGFLFQSPVSYYSRGAKWDISPGYQQHSSIYLTRPVSAKCLQCHASRLQPVAGTENGFQSPPFFEGGVSCERCHGPGKNHVDKILAGDRSGVKEIVNPAKLAGARRDSICAQCHLTGAARVARASRVAYRPGGRLSDDTLFFVWRAAPAALTSANSHFEELAASACKKAAGDRLWCSSCHDPHREPDNSGRITYYRARCLKCHESSVCKENLAVRRKRQDDCRACHMPQRPVRETEHAVFTDHSIPRRSPRAASASGAAPSLSPFWDTPITERDLGLAYAMAAAGDPALRGRARELLEKSEKKDGNDVLVLTQLAQLYDAMGQEDRAMAFSERVVRLDPSQAAITVNLGTYYMKRGRAEDAMRLWTAALTHNPSLTDARINLAVAQYRTGQPAAAEATLREALRYDPDAEIAQKMLAEIRAR